MPDPGSVEPALRIDLFTLFPAMFQGPLSESIVKRAVAAGTIAIGIHDIRDWTRDRHRTADDTPYGGGAGMVMKAPPIVEAVEAVLGDDLADTRILVMSAAGRQFTQPIGQTLASAGRVALICGHYEGIDQRVPEILGAEEVSIGDFVLTNGAIAAVVVVDAVVRLLPGVLGHEQSAADDSFSAGLLEAPQYTRPAEFRGWKVPDVLLSGNHAEIAAWRREQALKRTRENRPDLLE